MSTYEYHILRGNTCWTLFGSLRQFSLKRQMISFFSICHVYFILPCLILTTSYTKAVKSLFFLEEDIKPNRNHMSKSKQLLATNVRFLLSLGYFPLCWENLVHVWGCFWFMTILLHFFLFSYKLNKIQNPHVCSICLKGLIPE